MQMSNPKTSPYQDTPLMMRMNLIMVLRVILAILVMLILWSGIKVVEQTQLRHQVHIDIRKLNVEIEDLQTEEQRLMIEQQTFSATPQVASRAVSELGMFFPTGENRRLLPPAATPTDVSDKGNNDE